MWRAKENDSSGSLDNTLKVFVVWLMCTNLVGEDKCLEQRSNERYMPLGQIMYRAAYLFDNQATETMTYEYQRTLFLLKNG